MLASLLKGEVPALAIVFEGPNMAGSPPDKVKYRPQRL